MSGQRAAGNELSMAQTITAFRNENTALTVNRPSIILRASNLTCQFTKNGLQKIIVANMIT